MTDPQIDRKKLLDLMQAMGFQTQQEFALAIGLSGPKFSNILKGTRRAQVFEAQGMADALKVPLHTLLPMLGLPHNKTFAWEQSIGGFVDENERVSIVPEGSPEFGTHKVILPFLSDGGICLQVRGHALAPRYRDGDVIGIRRYPAMRATPATNGCDFVAKLVDGGIVLKVVYTGSTLGRFTLLSLKPHVAPILDAELEWAEPVEVCVPNPQKI